MSKGDKRRRGDEESFSENYHKIFKGKPKRGTYIQDPETGDMIPKDEFYRSRKTYNHMVMPDIKPYKSMVNGEMINSRSAHREHLKRNNLVEIGNETKYLKNARKEPINDNLRQRLYEVARDKLK